MVSTLLKYSHLIVLYLYIFQFNSFAQNINQNTFRCIETISDSILNEKMQQIPKIASHLVFLVKIRQDSDSQNSVIISNLYNGFDIKYYNFEYIKAHNNLVILFDINSSIVSTVDSFSLKPFSASDTALLQARLTSGMNWIFNDGKPLLFIVQQDGSLIYKTTTDQYIDNIHLLPPARIEKLRWE